VWRDRWVNPDTFRPMQEYLVLVVDEMSRRYLDCEPRTIGRLPYRAAEVVSAPATDDDVDREPGEDDE